MNDYSKINNDEYQVKSFISHSGNNEKLIQENITLKSDILIYKEDINRLTEMNNKLENELENYKRKIFDLIKVNEQYEKEILDKNNQINQLKDSINNINLFDNFNNDFPIGSRFSYRQKINEIVINNKTLNENNVRLITENKYLNEQISNLIKENQDLINKINCFNKRENEQINYLDVKLKNFEDNLDNISKENNQLKISNDKYLGEIDLIKNKNEHLEKKLLKKKNELNEILTKYNIIEDQNRNLDLLKRKKEEEQEKEKESRKQIFNDLKNKIEYYKSKLNKKEN